MKVFLSWSGDLSKRVAEELHGWLPLVIQALEPWLSCEDIEKGSRWGSHISKELAASKAGIICVTPDNLSSPWLNFEAGAISNTAWSSKVCTFLVGMMNTDLTGPLSQFQGTICDRKDTRSLVGTLNMALEKDALTEKNLDMVFDVFWPKLEKALEEIVSLKRPTRPVRTDRDIAEETLSIVRELIKQSPVNALNIPYSYITYPGQSSSGLISSAEPYNPNSQLYESFLRVPFTMQPSSKIILTEAEYEEFLKRQPIQGSEALGLPATDSSKKKAKPEG
ncbi:MAG: toll/interleukin-1 receptor domain-containing protein [Terracidiphilus sp.]|jgi:hypothetical protein